MAGLAAFIVWWRMAGPPPGAAEAERDERPLIVIDAGHGGVDGGTSGFGVLEKHAALDTALRTARELRRRGARVRLTRESDVTLELAERPRLANEWGADVLVSVHFNFSTHSPAIRGVEAYYSAPKTLEAQRGFAQKMERWKPRPVMASGVPDAAALLAGETMEAGPTAADLAAADEALAAAVSAAVAARARTPDRGARNRPGLAVTRHAATAAVLVECAFLSNEADAARAKTARWRGELAAGIADGVLAWMRQRAPLTPSAASTPAD